MSEKNHDFTSLVCIYAQLLPRIRAAAKELGYAIAIHGTMNRDLDLLAVPWVEDAQEPEKLVAAIQVAVGGYVMSNKVDERGYVSEKPTVQPHGRLSWNICWGGRPFIDLSIMPRAVKSLYHGSKDGKVYLTNADGIDDAYLQIGDLVYGVRVDDAGDVDLDTFGQVDLAPGQTIALNPD